MCKLRLLMSAGSGAMLLCTSWVSLMAAPPVSPPPTGIALMSAAVPVSDPARSLDFYVKGLGLAFAGKLDHPNVTEIMLRFPSAGAGLILMKAKDAASPLPVRTALNRLIVDVPDVDALRTRLVAAGFPFTSPIIEEPRYHVRVGHVDDPDGNVIELVQRPR